MLILYILSVISFFALVWAAISITRHIRRTSALPSIPPHAAAENAAAQDSPAGPVPTHISLSGVHRNPVATRAQSDWANLEKSIAKNDLGNTEYPRAPRRNPPAKNGA